MPSTSCLLVIDAQQSFTRRPFFSEEGLPQYLQAQNALIAGAQAAGWPVVRVLHHEPEAAAEAPFALASGLVRPLEGLSDFDASLEVLKSRHSALVGTGLDVWLVRQGLRRVVVSGIRTGQCCETTTRHGSDLGWQMVFVPEATMTWPLRGPDGHVHGAQALRARTAAVLDRRFARMCSVREALADGA